MPLLLEKAPKITALAVLFGGLLGGSMALAQRVPSSLMHDFTDEQRALREDITSLLLQGATPNQMSAWVEQNAAAFQEQMQRARLVAAYRDFQPKSYVAGVVIPTDASSTMEDFLVAHGNLFNSWAQIHNQLAEQNQQSITAQSASALNEAADELFAQQNGPALQAQNDRAASLAAASELQPLPVPSATVIPADASPQMRAFLLARDQLTQSEVAAHNQNCSGSLDQLDAAMELWAQQHADQIQQVNQLSANLTQSTPSP